MFRKVEVPVFGIIEENISYFSCPNCGHVSHIFAHGGAKAEAAKLGTDFLGEVPLHIAIRETSDGGIRHASCPRPTANMRAHLQGHRRAGVGENAGRPGRQTPPGAADRQLA